MGPGFRRDDKPFDYDRSASTHKISHEPAGATPMYLYWWRTLSSGLAGSLTILKTLITLLVMSPFWSKLISPCKVLTFDSWIASRTLARLTSLPAAATRLIESRITRAAS